MQRAHKCDESYAIHESVMTRHFYVGFPIFRLFLFYNIQGLAKPKNWFFKKTGIFRYSWVSLRYFAVNLTGGQPKMY